MKHTYYPVFFGLLILLTISACGSAGTRAQDSDSNGFSNANEMLAYGTDPGNPDTDGDGIPDGAEGFLAVKIDNKIENNASICAVSTGKTVTLFLPDGSSPAGQVDIPVGMSPAYRLNLAATGGLGIQVNLWYWDREPNIPIQQVPPQNPDNSGDQFILNANCEFTVQDVYFGKGVKTSKIATIRSRMDRGICVITVAPNSFTKCVTRRCCAPPKPEWDNVCQQADYYQSVCPPP